MEFVRGSVLGFDGVVREFVSSRDLVREWLSYEIGRSSSGMLWRKKCVENCEDLDNWDFEEVWYMFYRGYGEKIVWENWEENREMKKKQLLLF